MDTTCEERFREKLLFHYRKLQRKKRLSERMPNINVIFGDFLARAGHRRFFIYDCKSFINTKRTAGHFFIAFSVYNESSGEIDEFIARWHLQETGNEQFMVQRIVHLNEELENHFKMIFQEFIEFFKRENLLSRELKNPSI